MWFEKYSFITDPYVIANPFQIPDDRIRWDREDLSQKDNLTAFIKQVGLGYRSGLRAYGPAGSGKTWLMRYIAYQIRQDMGDEAVVLYGAIPGIEATFSVLYKTLIDSWLVHKQKVLAHIEAQHGPRPEGWRDFVSDADLASVLRVMNNEEGDKAVLAEEWLRGERLSASELRELGVRRWLSDDFARLQTLKLLIEVTRQVFQTCVLMIDELENAPPKLARSFGDALRDLMDSFYDHFGLVCGYTAQIAMEMLDWGYGEFLYGRLDYEVVMDPIVPEASPMFFRRHHESYREEELRWGPVVAVYRWRYSTTDNTYGCCPLVSEADTAELWGPGTDGR